MMALKPLQSTLAPGAFTAAAVVALALGQKIDCVIEIGAKCGSADGQVRLDCLAEVVRVEPIPSAADTFGIACQIREYSVLGPLGRQERWTVTILLLFLLEDSTVIGQ